MARGQGSTVSVRWGSVVVRRGRMCAAVRGSERGEEKGGCWRGEPSEGIRRLHLRGGLVSALV